MIPPSTSEIPRARRDTARPGAHRDVRALGISEVERGNHADLLEEFEVVELVPVFCELAVLGSPDVDGTHIDRVPGRRYSVERTSVRASVGESSNDTISGHH